MTHQQLYSDTGYASCTRCTLVSTKGEQEGVLWGKTSVFHWMIFVPLICRDELIVYIPAQGRSLREYPVLVPCDGRTAADLKGSSMLFIAWLTRTDKFPPHSQEISYYFKTFLCNYMGAEQIFFGLDLMN